MENIKKLWRLKTTISEMKNILHRINGKLDNIEGQVIQHENTVGTIQSETHRDKILRKIMNRASVSCSILPVA